MRQDGTCRAGIAPRSLPRPCRWSIWQVLTCLSWWRPPSW